ncbi:MAG: hypothetical protein AAB626_02730 [Patescibacteria group bacterium]
MPESEYVPTGPYFLKSGKRIGKSLEELMFEDYSMLLVMRSKITVAKNEMQKHLLWLMDRGEDRVATLPCPYCKEKNLSFFAYSFKERKYYTCCDNWYPCIGEVLSKAQRFPLKFSSIARFQWASRPYIMAFFKSVFFPGCENLTAQQLFEFFSKITPSL